MKRLGLILFFLPLLSFAAPSWNIVPTKSQLGFVATQNNSPLTGQFKTFSGKIDFAPEQLDTSRVEMIVDTASVATSYTEVADNLKTANWLSVALFPQAIFKANHFTKTGDKTYAAIGTLTLRDKTLPLTVQFTLEEYTADHATVKGNAQLNRIAYGVGQGEWKNTDTIKDAVKVEFVLVAVKK